MIFVDTGAFIARYIERDQFHSDAVRYWKKLEQDNTPLWTSNFVLDEVFTLLGRIAGNRFAIDRSQAIFNSTILTILRPDLEIEQNALTPFRKYADQNISFTDCVSFVLMKKHHIQDVFTFDNHFHLAGFKVHP